MYYIAFNSYYLWSWKKVKIRYAIETLTESQTYSLIVNYVSCIPRGAIYMFTFCSCFRPLLILFILCNIHLAKHTLIRIVTEGLYMMLKMIFVVTIYS